MKTPDEIKKGLRVCDHVGRVLKVEAWCKEKCPYMDKVYGCGQDYMLADALALIQQLERQNNERWSNNLTMQDALTKQERVRSNLQERISQLEAENAALLRDLREADCVDCMHCRHYRDVQLPCSCDCDTCEVEDCACKDCRDNNHWEWRGVQKEE